MSDPYRVPAVGAAMRVLGSLVAADGNGESQSELARATGISKSTMHNLLATLETAGYVRRNPQTLRYHLGGALIALGAAAAQQVQSLPLAVDRLPALAATHHVSAAVALVTPEEDAQVTNRAYPPESLHVGIRIGSRYGYFDGAIGKCLLAALDPERARQLVLARPIPAHTERTVTEPQRLLEEVARVRERGWGASIGEYNSNIAVAATVYDAGGGAEAMLLALAFPSDQGRAAAPEIGRALSEEAAFITRHAGGTPPGRAGAASGQPPGGSPAAGGQPPGGSPMAQPPNTEKEAA